MEILKKNKSDVARAIRHLEYSLAKVQRFELSRQNWSEEELEVMESFSSRFARTAELAVSRLFRSMALSTDPAFRGTVIDLLNLAEKQGWISSAKTWLRIRELRNVAAHEYSTEDFNGLITELIQLTPVVLEVKKLV